MFERAYFYAPARRDLYIELPAEDGLGSRSRLGEINQPLYGTRDAATNWQEVLAEHFVSLGFVRGNAHPCIFTHPDRCILTMVHGDDYLSAGEVDQLAWLEGKLKDTYEIKTQKILPFSSCTEGNIFNRIVRWSEKGWEIEADQRHSELIVEQLELQDATPLSTPGCDDDGKDSEEHRVELTGADVAIFRCIVARCLYLSLDRPDLLFASKEA